MTKNDVKTKQQYIKAIDNLYHKYIDKTMKAPFDSWAFKASQLVRVKMHELKRELEKLNLPHE